MNQGRRRHQAIDDRHGIWDIETSPLLGDTDGDRDEAVPIAVNQLAEPTGIDLGLSRVPPGQPRNALPDLTDSRWPSPPDGSPANLGTRLSRQLTVRQGWPYWGSALIRSVQYSSANPTSGAANCHGR